MHLLRSPWAPTTNAQPTGQHSGQTSDVLSSAAPPRKPQGIGGICLLIVVVLNCRCQLIAEILTARNELASIEAPRPQPDPSLPQLTDDIEQYTHELQRRLHPLDVVVERAPSEANEQCPKTTAVWGRRREHQREIWCRGPIIFVRDRTIYPDGGQLRAEEAHTELDLGGWSLSERRTAAYAPNAGRPYERNSWIRSHDRWIHFAEYDENSDGHIDWRQCIRQDLDRGTRHRVLEIDERADGKIDRIVEEWIRDDEQLVRRRQRRLPRDMRIPWSVPSFRLLSAEAAGPSGQP